MSSISSMNPATNMPFVLVCGSLLRILVNPQPMSTNAAMVRNNITSSIRTPLYTVSLGYIYNMKYDNANPITNIYTNELFVDHELYIHLCTNGWVAGCEKFDGGAEAPPVYSLFRSAFTLSGRRSFCADAMSAL